MDRMTSATKRRILPGKLLPVVMSLLLLATMAISLPGCSGKAYTQTLKITAEPVNVSGLVTKVEYYQDGELTNSLIFIDGNGDKVIDGKSGPSKQNCWPNGWEWFDDMYAEVTVEHSTMETVGNKVRIQASSNTYDLLPAEYECGDL
ncbi:MAG: hypothetical protein J7K94_01000 [Dehalococcoidia bacterium]|nr:hypothetical protein [Dehalococcoidia bacterium]